VKSKHDPRHQKRIKSIQALYAWGVTGNFDSEAIIEIIPQLPEIDKQIAKAAPKWPTDQINKVDLAILRYSIWELKNQDKTPPKVIIDEAIEIGKELSDTKSASFINAVLGYILKNEHGQN